MRIIAPPINSRVVACTNRIFIFAFAALFLASALCSTAASQEDLTSRPELRVGFIGPFSGTRRELGLAAREGFELSLRDRGESGFRTFYEDDRGDSVAALEAFHKLRSRNKVHLIISIGDHASGLLTAAADEFQIPLLIWASLSKAADPETYAIQTKIDGTLEGQFLGLEAVRRGYKRIAIAYSPLPEFQRVLEGFRSVAGEDQITTVEKIEGSREELQQFLSSARNKHSTALGLFLKNGQPSVIARETRTKAFLADMFGTDTLLSYEEMRLSKDTLLGSWCVGVDASPEFRQSYMQRFREGGFIKVAAIHHDLARLLVNVSRKLEQDSEVFKLITRSAVEGGVLKGFQITRAGTTHSVRVPLMIYEATEKGFNPIPHPPQIRLEANNLTGIASQMR